MAPLLDAAALGLGEATLESRLNEPLDVRIEVVGARFDAGILNASLASEAQHDRAGIETGRLLGSLRVEAFVTRSGEGHVRVTTKQSIREPVVSFLLVVENARERVMREYNLLLDPPGYSLPVTAMPQPRPRYRPTPRSEAATAPASRAVAPAVRVTAPRPGLQAVHIGPVARGDTLSKLATQLRRDRGVTWAQMTWALFTENPHAFINEDINRLKAGVYLRVPSTDSASRWSHREALALINGAPAERGVALVEIREPVAQESAASTTGAGTGDKANASSLPPKPETPAEPSSQQVSPQTTPDAEPVSNAEAAPPQPLFRLASPDEIDEPRASGAVGAPLTPVERERIDQMVALANRQIQDSQEEIARARLQLSETAKQIATLVETVTRKDAEIQGLQSRIADLRELNEQRTIAMAKSEPSWINRLLLETFLLGAMVVVLAVTLSRWTDARRRREARPEPKVIRLASPAPVNETEESANTVIVDEINSEPADDEANAESSGDEGVSIVHVPIDDARITSDPLMEANAYFAYGYYDKAKEVLQGFIKANPGSAESRLVMLRVLHALREKRGFRRHAEALLELVDDHFDERWGEAVRLGRALFPDERLFNANAYRRAGDEKWEETIWTGTRPEMADSDDHVYLDLDEFKYVDLFLLDEGSDDEEDMPSGDDSSVAKEIEKSEAELARWSAQMAGEERGFTLGQNSAAKGSEDDEPS